MSDPVGRRLGGRLATTLVATINDIISHRGSAWIKKLILDILELKFALELLILTGILFHIFLSPSFYA